MPALTAPALLDTSEGLGWDGVDVRSYAEPPQMASWRAPETSALTLVLVTQGAMQLEQRRLDGPWRPHLLRPGELLLRPSGRAPYELRWRVCSPEPMQTLHIHIAPELVAQTAAALGGVDPGHLAIRELVGLDDPLLSALGHSLGRALVEATPTDALYAQTAAQLLAAHLVRFHSGARTAPPERPAGLTPRQVLHIVAYVHAHLDQAVSLDLLGQQVGYSPYHFARLFRQATGESPYQFVLGQRVARAQQLLGTSRAPLMEVALTCGFANQSHLTRVFRRRLGLTPQGYRRLRSGSA